MTVTQQTIHDIATRGQALYEQSIRLLYGVRIGSAAAYKLGAHSRQPHP